MLLLNYTHPLTPAQIAQVEQLTGQKVERVMDIPAQFDPNLAFAPQAAALAEQAGLTPQAWQGEPIVVNLPSLNYIAALLLVEMHGRMGYFPSVLRLRPVPGSLTTQYEVAEVLNLQSVRDAARRARNPLNLP
jgi:hypothetical protein